MSLDKVNWNKRMTRRDMIKNTGKFTAAGAVLLWAAGCIPGLGRDNGSSTADFTGELSLLLGSHMDYIEALGPVYLEQFGVEPGIEFVTTPDLQNMLTSSFLARTSPWDAVFSNAHVAQDMGENGWFRELQDRLNSLEDYKILEGSLQAVQFDGKQFAIPITTGCPIMLWNKQMFEEFGLDPEAPTNWHSTRNSWDTFVEYAKEMTREVNGKQYYGYVDAWGDLNVMWFYRALVQMHGGDLLDDEFQPVMNSEEGVESLQKMVDLLHTHKCVDPAVATYTWVFDASPSFLNGTRGMFMTWPFMEGVANHGDDSDIKGMVGAAPNPAIETSASSDGSEFLAIPTFSDNAEEAWRFIQLVTSYDKQRQQGINTGWLPIYEELLDDPDVVAANPTAPVVRQAYQYPTKGYYSPDYLRWADILSEEIREALSQRKTPKQALDDTVREIERVRRND